MNNSRQKRIKLIADGPLFEALALIWGGSQPIDEFTQRGEILVVYAHTLTEEVANRSSLGGLNKLQQILAHPRSAPVNTLVLGFTSTQDLGRYQYLLQPYGPFRYLQIPRNLPIPSGNAPNTKAWRNVTRAASEEELEMHCSIFRHGLQSVMAAARIYLGAAIVGHARTENCEKVLTKFSFLAQREGASNVMDPAALSKSLQAHSRFRSDYATVRKPKGCDLWVLDDHWEDHGWKEAFSQLPLRSLRGFTDWDTLKLEIESDRRRPSVLFVDCNLGTGDNIPTGLELLQSIRSVWQGVRVVFATAYDDAALALTSIREGANVFFAKALNDTGDRRSKDYYERLVKLLAISPFEQSTLQFWRSFKTVITNGKLGSEFPAALEPMLRLAFYLLFSSIDDNLWWRGSRMRFSRKHLFRAVVNLIRAGDPELEEEAFVDDEQVGLVLMGGPHGGAPITFGEVSSVFDYILRRLGTASQQQNAGPLILDEWAPPRPDYWPYAPKDLQSDSNYPGLPPGVAVGSHETRDTQGAIELLRGFCCNRRCKHTFSSVKEILTTHAHKQTSTLYEDVVIIDDCGVDNGWFTAVEFLLPGCRAFTDVKSFQAHSGNVSLVILDLRLPSLEMGMKALRQILKKDPSVPILTMSAASQSLAAIRSLREGAIDFVSKTLPAQRNLDASFLFADEFLSKCKLLRDYGRSTCRAAWKQLYQLRKDPIWSADAIVTIQTRIDKCAVHRGNRKGWQVPPDVHDWTANVADEIALLLHLRQQLYWRRAKKTVQPNKTRIDFKQVCRVRPLDYWRWKAVLGYKGSSDIVRLTAVLAGVVVERLARWQTCLLSQKSLDPRLWGSDRATGTIQSTISANLGRSAAFVWDIRNAALYPDRQQPSWDQPLCEKLIASVFEVVSHFLESNGAELSG